MIRLFLQATQERTGLLFRDGKLNTVIVVLFIIFCGIALYLFLLDRKISKIEKMSGIHSTTSQKIGK